MEPLTLIIAISDSFTVEQQGRNSFLDEKNSSP